MPFISLNRRGTACFNFGKQKFRYGVDGYNPVHCSMTDRDLAKLSALFQKYRDLGNEESKEEHGSQLTKSMEIERVCKIIES